MKKICNVCGQEKEHKSWKATTCNDCLEKGVKWCSSCHEPKPITDFHKNGNTLRSFCKKCECSRSIKSKKETGYYNKPGVKEKRNENSRLCKRAKYKFDEEYRIRELVRCHDRRSSSKGEYSEYDWLCAIQAFDNKCAYCGTASKLSMDHIVPISKGGLSEPCNIIPACQSCNSSKQNKEMLEWYKGQDFYSEERLKRIYDFVKARR